MARIGRHPVRSVMMRIVVTGGRDFIDVPLLWCRLDEAHSLVDITLLIDGASDDVTGPYIGFDYWSNQWAPARFIRTQRVHAEWRKYGQAAGPIRNQKMLADYKPALLIAGPGKHGTANMMDLARKAGIEIWEVR